MVMMNRSASCDPTTDPVIYLGLQAIGSEIARVVGPAIAFVALIDWRSGDPRLSYLSNAPRRQAVAALGEWYLRTAAATDPAAAPARSPTTVLTRQAASLVRDFDDEDVGTAIFLFAGEEAGAETAWCTSIAINRVRAVVENLVAMERKHS